jgi:hypothetical protein
MAAAQLLGATAPARAAGCTWTAQLCKRWTAVEADIGARLRFAVGAKLSVHVQDGKATMLTLEQAGMKFEGTRQP